MKIQLRLTPDTLVLSIPDDITAYESAHLAMWFCFVAINQLRDFPESPETMFEMVKEAKLERMFVKDTSTP